jgi:hypothetical protein
VFGLAAEEGLTSNAELAQRMGISEALVSHTRRRRLPVSGPFIRCAFRAFPGKTFDDLFVVEREPPGNRDQQQSHFGVDDR